MKKTTKILSAIALSAVVAFGATSCKQTRSEGTEAAATETSEASAPKGAIVYIDMTVLMADYDMARQRSQEERTTLPLQSTNIRTRYRRVS